VVVVKTKDDYAKVLEEVSTLKPRVIGFSSVSSQFSFVKEIADLVKTRHPGIITVCGGVHPTINPSCVSETRSLNGIFVGESEHSFIEFLRKVEREESYKDTDNLAYMENGKLVVNRLKPLIADLDTLPFPDREVYPFEENLKTTGHVTFFFSRGCPFTCSYCSNHAIAKTYGIPRNFTRYRSPESSIREIEDTMERFRVGRIYIGDDIFGLDKAWRREFCEKYKKRIKAQFGCLLRADIITEEFMRLLKDAGCYRAEIGIESGNEYVRNKIMNRNMSNDQIIRAFDIARADGLETNAINIIGVPGETEEMIWDTVRLNRRVRPTSSGVNIFYPYRGTVLGDRCFDQGMVNEYLYNTFSNERRDTVLNYPEDVRKRLLFYRDNWESLVYPFDVKRRISRLIKNRSAWKYLRKIKRRALYGKS